MSAKYLLDSRLLSRVLVLLLSLARQGGDFSSGARTDLVDNGGHVN